MKAILRTLVIALLALLLLPAAGCPPNPGPAGTGGAPGTGGAQTAGSVGSGGEIPTAGAPSATGGASVGAAGQAATGGAQAVDWPECAPPTQKARPVVKHPLGRKRGAVTRHLRTSYSVLDLPDVGWLPLFPALNQRSIGACTGFATLQCRLSEPWAWGGTSDIEELNKLALSIYSGATKRDPWKGVWPPDDTGSGGQWALDEATSQGVFSGYDEVVSFEALQRALQRGPCITGTDWPEGFFAPDRCGAVKKTGANAGGHEWVVQGIRYETKQILGRTSWDIFGVDWHDKSGFFWVTFGTFQELLNAGGDIHCPQVGNDNAIQHREAG